MIQRGDGELQPGEFDNIHGRFLSLRPEQMSGDGLPVGMQAMRRAKERKEQAQQKDEFDSEQNRNFTPQMRSLQNSHLPFCPPSRFAPLRKGYP